MSNGGIIITIIEVFNTFIKGNIKIFKRIENVFINEGNFVFKTSKNERISIPIKSIRSFKPTKSGKVIITSNGKTYNFRLSEEDQKLLADKLNGKVDVVFEIL